MKKVLVLMSIVLMLAVIMSCASTSSAGAEVEAEVKKEPEIKLTEKPIVLGKDNVPRPEWIIKDYTNKETIYVQGYGKGATFEVSYKKARLDADAELGRYVSNVVQTAVARTLESNESVEEYTYIDQFKTSASEVGKGVLAGAQVADYWEDKEGGVWVLVSIPTSNLKEQVASTIEKASNAIGNNTTAKTAVAKLNASIDDVIINK
ncbi:MAG: LPP20 family lipoprotein [Spirochaetales bacterium]|nr:LPP20 family lipoprotein [Spirochaetales bacterium]